MALAPDQKFSTFVNAGDLVDGDLIVGLRDGVNARFTYVLPDSVNEVIGTINQVLVNGSYGTPVTGSITLTLPQDIATGSSPTFAGLTLSAPLSSASGGTGINNGSSTLTLAGSLSTVGAYISSFTMTGNTSVTFPTSGTLLTSATAVSSLAATANQTTVSGATGDVVVGLASNAIMPGTGGLTLPQGNTAARAGSAGTIRFNTQSAVFESTVDGTNWAVIDTSASGDVDSIIGTTNQVIASNPTGNVTLSLPQDIATTSQVQFNSVRLSNNGIKDANNNVIIGLQAATSAVNYALIQNNSTGGAVVISAQGTDTDISMTIRAKGSSPVRFVGGDTTNGFQVSNGTGLQHSTLFSFPNTAASRAVTFPDSSGTVLFNTSLKAPTIQQFTSGSGTYTTPTNPAPLYIRVIAVGGGGGGQGGAGAGQGNGTSGGNTTFGGTLIIANGGANAAGSGGTVSIGAGAGGIGVSGGRGGTAVQLVNSSGGNGAPGAFGGAGNGGGAAYPGNAGATGSGSGGGGGGASGSAASGGGGSAGAYADAIIISPAATYAYAVGAAGSGGAAGAGAGAGGNGGSGRVTVYEFYQ